jgi:hypothetical protein
MTTAGRGTDAATTAGKVKPVSGMNTALGLVAIGVIALFVCAFIYHVINPTADDVHRNKAMAALGRCQEAIHALAEYGGADTPPYTKNWGKGNEFYFAWPRGSFEFTNGFGAKVKMSASCSGDLETGVITDLTVNGKDVISR